MITGECSFEDAVIQAEQYPNLNILANGETKVNPSELLDSQRWHTLCQHLRGSYQYVIIDSPPIASVADCELLQMAADGTILVVRPEHTKRTIFFKAQKSIPADKFLGSSSTAWIAGSKCLIAMAIPITDLLHWVAEPRLSLEFVDYILYQ